MNDVRTTVQSTDAYRTFVRIVTAVRATVRRHPSAALAIGGFIAASLTVVAGGRVGTVKSVIPLTNWLGLMPKSPHQVGDYIPSVVMLFGIAVLVALWLVAIRTHHAGATGERHVWAIGAAWATPFAIGPPLLSNDVFTYAAQGLLMRNGLNPYEVGPSALGNVPAVAAVDPSWRSISSPYGPLASTIQHLAVAISGGDPLGATIVFRALGVVCLVAIGLLAAELAGSSRRMRALTMTVLNPLVLIHVVSGAHLDGVMCALLLGAVVAANRRHWAVAIVLAAAAGSVKAPAYLAVLAIIAVHQGGRGRVEWRRLARDASIGAASVVGFSLTVTDGWGWTRGLDAPALGHTSLAPATLVADMFRPIVRGASFDDLTTAGRITALLAATCIVAYLIATIEHRSLDATVGFGMLAVGVLSPVVYPWYLLGGVLCLIPTARGARRDWLIWVSAVGCLLNPLGFSSAITTALSTAAVAVCLAVIAPRVLRRRRAAKFSRGVDSLSAVG